MRENAWLTDFKLFAPYDGITRFRFKGSSDLSDLSASGSPASEIRIGADVVKSTRDVGR